MFYFKEARPNKQIESFVYKDWVYLKEQYQDDLSFHYTTFRHCDCVPFCAHSGMPRRGIDEEEYLKAKIEFEWNIKPLTFSEFIEQELKIKLEKNAKRQEILDKIGEEIQMNAEVGSGKGIELGLMPEVALAEIKKDYGNSILPHLANTPDYGK